MFSFKPRAKEREAPAVTDDCQSPEGESDVSGNAAQPESPPLEGFSAPGQSMRERMSGMIEEIRAESRAYLAEVQIGRALAQAPAEKVSAAREFVRNSKVGMAAIGVWAATIHYSAWCKREGWPKLNYIGVSDIADDPLGTRGFRLPESTGFRWRERAWMFTLDDRRPSYTGHDTYARFRVWVDVDLVMELTAAKGPLSEYFEWAVSDVNALTVGPWVGALVEMWAELRLGELRREAETETARLEAQAARIKLG